jgi:hypothetical protein
MVPNDLADKNNQTLPPAIASIAIPAGPLSLENRGYRPTANWVEKHLRMCLEPIPLP